MSEQARNPYAHILKWYLRNAVSKRSGVVIIAPAEMYDRLFECLGERRRFRDANLPIVHVMFEITPIVRDEAAKGLSLLAQGEALQKYAAGNEAVA